MEVYFKPGFIKDFKKLPSDIQGEVRSICTEIFPKLPSIRDFHTHPLKPLRGFKNYFRIKLGDYRLGLKLRNDNGIEFMRVKHRRDIYRHFP